MAQTYVDLGYAVDVVNAADSRDFVPAKQYSVFVGHRHHFDRIASRLVEPCLKVLHCDVAHWLFHNTAGYGRLLDLQKRRGLTLPLLRLQEPNRAIELADAATVLGNEFTIGTYRYAGTPIHRIPISTPAVYDWPKEKAFDNHRRTFLWFNSNGFVHKGLDLVLEAFARMPDLQLIVCGPVNDEIEKQFIDAYDKELYGMPNIRTVGWIEVASEEFRQIANSCVAVISASCSEGGGGSILSCMQAGLIPVVNDATSVDIGSFGAPIKDCSIQGIIDAVTGLANAPLSEIEDRARRTWEFARANHTRERFAEKYRDFASSLVHAGCGRTEAASVHREVIHSSATRINAHVP